MFEGPKKRTFATAKRMPKKMRAQKKPISLTIEQMQFRRNLTAFCPYSSTNQQNFYQSLQKRTL